MEFDMEISREDIYSEVQSLVEQKDLFAASEYVFGIGNPARVAEAFACLVLDSHHKAKSTEQVIHFGSSGINYCLSQALHLKGEDAKAMRFAAKRMATNIASFTWPGWDDKKAQLSQTRVKQGLEYARFSIRQLKELDPTAAQLSFTYWFLGAQLLANKLYDEAIKTFKLSRNYALEQGDDKDAVHMHKGYLGMARILNGQKESGEATYKEALAFLEKSENEDAEFYADQLKSVRAVFEK